MLKHIVMVSLVVGGCGKSAKPDEAKPGSGSGSAVAVASGSGSAADAKKPAPKDKPKKAPLSTAAKADYKKHMKAGWALQKDKKWAEAVPEFEAALKASPDEQRALAELGWSAMNAGDFPKARAADEKAIAVAVDKNVKAAGYYNLGSVQEKSGDKDGALTSYLASLTLRPNKIVMDAVGKLGADPKAAPPPMCAGLKPCECAYELSLGVEESESTCTEGAAPAKGLHRWTVAATGDYSNSYSYLFDEADRYVAGLALIAEHGRHYEKSDVAKLEVKTITGHRVLWLETTQHDDASYMTDGDETAIENLEGRMLTVCVLGDAKTPTACPIRELWLERKDTTEYMPDDPDKKSSKKDETTETILSATLADDGVVTVKLVKGASDPQIDALVGPHKLW